MRKYDKNMDEYYSPDATPDVYLDETTVNEVLNKIPTINKPDEIAVRETIKKLEELHRNIATKGMSVEDSKKVSNKLSDDFLKKFGFWPYVTKTYEAFYESFEK